MLRFEGDRDFAQAPAELFARLSDARFLVQCIPDVHEVKSQEEHNALVELRPSFAFMTGKLDVEMQIVDVTSPTSARVMLKSKTMGGSADVETTLAMSEQAGGTRVHWTAEVKKLTGFLKLIPSGLIRGAAEQVITDAWARVAEKLG